MNKLNDTHYDCSTLFEWTALGPEPKHPLTSIFMDVQSDLVLGHFEARL